MEKTILDVVSHAKGGMGAVLAWFRGIPFVGEYLDFAAYGFAVYAVGHFYLNWW